LISKIVSPEEQPTTDTATVHSREEAERVRATAMNPDAALVCPRCSEALTVGPAVYHQRGSKRYRIRALTCPACHRCLSMKEMPDRLGHE